MISRRKHRHGHSGSGRSRNARAGADQEAEASPVALFDTDNDGTVDLAEAKKAAGALFDRLDKDKDGTLDIKELQGRLSRKDFAAADPDKTRLRPKTNISPWSRSASRLPIRITTVPQRGGVPDRCRPRAGPPAEVASALGVALWQSVAADRNQQFAHRVDASGARSRRRPPSHPPAAGEVAISPAKTAASAAHSCCLASRGIGSDVAVLARAGALNTGT